MPGVEINWDNPTLAHSLPSPHTHSSCILTYFVILFTYKLYSVHIFTAHCSFLHLCIHTNYRKMKFSTSPTTITYLYFRLENYGYSFFVLFWQQPRVIHFLIPLIRTLCAPPVCVCVCVCMCACARVWWNAWRGWYRFSPSKYRGGGAVAGRHSWREEAATRRGAGKAVEAGQEKTCKPLQNVHLSLLQLELSLFT